MGRRNPNGYGCVTFLKGNRKRPWVVKVTMYDQDGKARQKPVGYAETESEANILLAQYNNDPWDIERETITLVMLFNRWYEIKASKLKPANRAIKLDLMIPILIVSKNTFGIELYSRLILVCDSLLIVFKYSLPIFILI